MKCGKPLGEEDAEYCEDCSLTAHVFAAGRGVFVYNDAIRLSLYRFKYANRREYAYFYAARAAEKYGDWMRRVGIRMLVPIPLYASKQKVRGYNQAEVFAVQLGRILGIPVRADLLIRVRKTVPQKELRAAQRKINLKNAFQLAEKGVELDGILLIDDIYTTGSTMDAAASVLLENGADKVHALYISIGDTI